MIQAPFFTTKNGQLYLGDCLEIMPEIPTGSVDMILCDLPYGIADCKWDKRIDMDQLWAEYRRVCKSNAAIVLTAQRPFATDLINAARKWFRYEIIWEKSMALGFFNAKKMPLRAHENILVFYRNLPTYNPQMTEGTPYKRNGQGRVPSVYRACDRIFADNKGTRYPRSVQRWAQELQNRHPTAKPQAMFEWLIRTYTYPRETVLDNCVGGGTTAVAAEKLGRRWLAIEKEAEYCEITKRRLEELEESDGI
ncbi:MAG: site-specific DNA-methyltransferase [Synergistaceae bacterium]|jgi:site-specific DNA-methyltransferase (adenine-specific)|nr:site-specific DNA-methyltransferase [Synergistaceae bacterium]